MCHPFFNLLTIQLHYLVTRRHSKFPLYAIITKMKYSSSACSFYRYLSSTFRGCHHSFNALQICKDGPTDRKPNPSRPLHSASIRIQNTLASKYPVQNKPITYIKCKRTPENRKLNKV